MSQRIRFRFILIEYLGLIWQYLISAYLYAALIPSQFTYFV